MEKRTIVSSIRRVDGVHSNAVVESTVLGVARFQERLQRMLEQRQLDHKDRFAIRLAVEEALSNAVKHGNRCNPAKEVHVTFSVTSIKFLIRVSDEGDGFDPNDVPDPTTDKNLDKPTGRGLLLMRHFMHNVGFNHKGNAVSMGRRFTAA